MRVSANGGTPETIVSSGPGQYIQRVQMLPDGDTLLFTSIPSSDDAGSLGECASRRVVAQIEGP